MPIFLPVLLTTSLVTGASALSTVADSTRRVDSRGEMSQSMNVSRREGAALIEQRRREGAAFKDRRGARQGHGAGSHRTSMGQTPEELGFVGEVAEASDSAKSVFSESYCLDIGAKGFPIPVFKMMQLAKWNASAYFEELKTLGYADDALQMTGPQEVILKSDCMQEGRQSKTKHIFVGDSQMMALRNALHRLNGCPEIWWRNTTWDHQELLASIKAGKRVKTNDGRIHAQTDQTPDGTLPKGCKEEGIASFIFWDAWLDWEIPLQEIKNEMKQLGVEPNEGDTVVVWIGSNSISAASRKGVLLTTIDRLHVLGVKMVWDSPTYIDEVMMAATTPKDMGKDSHSGIPITYTAIAQRKVRSEIGSNQYKSEKAFLAESVEIPMTKRWQLTNRYRGLQCDGIHNDIRARDSLYYDLPCPKGPESYGRSTHCNWVEPFDDQVKEDCPQAIGLDDLVLQSGLFAVCAAHERPFCYAHTERIR